MANASALDEQGLLAALRQVLAGRYPGKPLFLWRGPANDLKSLIEAAPDLAGVVANLGVNTLAADVLPKMSRQRLRERLEASLAELISDGRTILIVEEPYLLLKYEPAAPLSIFWNRFVRSDRAVVVAVPEPVARPHTLPSYIRFNGDALGDALLAGGSAARVVLNGG